jgi:Spy/CpxP family protein refolding chaperone
MLALNVSAVALLWSAMGAACAATPHAPRELGLPWTRYPTVLGLVQDNTILTVLEITPEQRGALFLAKKEYAQWAERWPAAFTTQLDKLEETVTEFLQHAPWDQRRFEAAVAETLGEAKFNRLKQLRRQIAGVSLLYKSDWEACPIGDPGESVTTGFRAIQAREFRRGKPTAEQRLAAEAEVLALLTPAQRKTWSEWVGPAAELGDPTRFGSLVYREPGRIMPRAWSIGDPVWSLSSNKTQDTLGLSESVKSRLNRFFQTYADAEVLLENWLQSIQLEMARGVNRKVLPTSRSKAVRRYLFVLLNERQQRQLYSISLRGHPDLASVFHYAYDDLFKVTKEQHDRYSAASSKQIEERGGMRKMMERFMEPRAPDRPDHPGFQVLTAQQVAIWRELAFPPFSQEEILAHSRGMMTLRYSDRVGQALDRWNWPRPE